MQITKTSLKTAKAFIDNNKRIESVKLVANTLLYKQRGLAVMKVKDTNIIEIDEEGYTYFTLNSKVAVDRVNGYLHEVRAEAHLAWIDGKPHAWVGEWKEINTKTDLTSLVNLAYS